jgi:hypothetical protein
MTTNGQGQGQGQGQAQVTARLMNVGRKLQARVRDFFDAAPDATAPPLELLQATLDQLERKVQSSGRGIRSFPYNRVIVHIAQPAADRNAIDTVFADLPARLRERLAELRCELPADFEASAAYEEATDTAQPVLWIECSNTADAVAPLAATDELPTLRLLVIAGQCEQPDYTFQQRAIAIGRGATPTDTSGRMRHNQIAFLEVRDGTTETVARAHARLEFDDELRAYVLFNESSTNPTFIRRDGRNLRVAPRDPRGVRVQPGDELQLGRALLRIASPDPSS